MKGIRRARAAQLDVRGMIVEAIAPQHADEAANTSPAFWRYRAGRFITCFI